MLYKGNPAFWLLNLILIISGIAVAQEVRIKDLANVKGNRPNQLIGLGLVVGLSGTGDSKASMTTNKAVANLITRLGVHSSVDSVLTKSVAAVVVTAEMPAFAKNGDKIDVKASVIGDAKSLAGGMLLQTPLKAGNGDTYVIAQGSVVVGQADGRGAKVMTSALVPQGGTVEREFVPSIVTDGFIYLSLNNPDFTTNTRIVEKINQEMKGFYAVSMDPATIKVELPESYKGIPVEFFSDIENMKVQMDQKAKVVINEKTGTVVMGSDVIIGNIVITHGDLSIQVGAKGESKKRLVDMGGTTVGNLVKGLNEMGVKPADLIGILQAIHASGGLKAELKFL
ncbi:MAG: flagellar basal body P-ring protein FlgI [Oligoflexales bacterium]|nr:flagellar basal body P-ring protein FlgI [Oligoflexales bacterium]